MRTPLARFLFALPLVCLTASPATAQLIPGLGHQAVHVRTDRRRPRPADARSRSQRGRRQRRATDLRRRAAVEHHHGRVHAVGNVTLVSPTARLSAERVVFNTKTGLGTFYDASGLASLGDRVARPTRACSARSSPTSMFCGETIEKIDDDKYRITNGWFTTCVQPTPRWEIVTGTATINLEDYAILQQRRHARQGRAGLLPPGALLPDSERRSRHRVSAADLRQLRLSGDNRLSNAFFWAINRSQDLTLFHDWFTNSGQGVGVGVPLHRWRPARKASSAAYWLWQEAADDRIRWPKHHARRKAAATRSAAAWRRCCRRDCARARASSTSRTSSTQAAVQHEHLRGVAPAADHRRQRHRRLGQYQRHRQLSAPRDLPDPDRIDRQRLCAARSTANLSSKRLGTLPFYVSANSEASRIIYQDRRVHAVKRISASTGSTRRQPSARRSRNWPFLNVNGVGRPIATPTTARASTTVGVQVPIPVSRRYFDLRTDIVGPTFSRVFTPNNAIADRLKHVIEPNVSIQRITDFEHSTTS